MLKEINIFITGLVPILSWGYLISKILGRKIQINVKNISLFILTILIMYLILKLNMGFSKTIVIYFLYTIFFKQTYNISFNKSLILNFISTVVHFICEFLFAVLISILNLNSDLVKTYLDITPLSGLIIFVLVIFIWKILGSKIITLSQILQKEKIYNLFYITLIIFLSILFSYNINVKVWQTDKFIINIITIFIFAIMLFFLLNEKYKVIKANDRFDKLFNNSKKVSTLLEKYQKINHENKNDLRVIKSKIPENNEIQEYIDLILKEKNISQNSKWISEINKINDIGIGGFLSLKINEMVDKNINVTVNISNNIKKYNFEDLNKYEKKDICRILGVYLDNAYDASINSIEKEITIEMNVNNQQLEIIISNTFTGVINYNNIGNYGYTTKGKGHGVGLSLVNDIIEKNNKFSQERKIVKNYYFQYFYIISKNKDC